MYDPDITVFPDNDMQVHPRNILVQKPVGLDATPVRRVLLVGTVLHGAASQNTNTPQMCLSPCLKIKLNKNLAYKTNPFTSSCRCGSRLSRRSRELLIICP